MSTICKIMDGNLGCVICEVGFKGTRRRMPVGNEYLDISVQLLVECIVFLYTYTQIDTMPLFKQWSVNSTVR